MPLVIVELAVHHFFVSLIHWSLFVNVHGIFLDPNCICKFFSQMHRIHVDASFCLTFMCVPMQIHPNKCIKCVTHLENLLVFLPLASLVWLPVSWPMFEKMRILDFVVGREHIFFQTRRRKTVMTNNILSLSFWGAGCLTGYAVENVVPVRLDRLTLA